jgi:hypothetical protein
MEEKSTEPLSSEKLQRTNEQILSRIDHGLKELEVVFKCKKPVRGLDKEGTNVDIDGSSAYTDEALIVEGDRRRKVNNSEEWPFCMHGRFTAQLPDETLVGSGAMIGPDPVLKCAQNVCMHGIGEIRKDCNEILPKYE